MKERNGEHKVHIYRDLELELKQANRYDLWSKCDVVFVGGNRNVPKLITCQTLQSKKTKKQNLQIKFFSINVWVTDLHEWNQKRLDFHPIEIGDRASEREKETER